MGSKNIKLPKINFSHEDLKPDTLEWNQVKSQVYKALVEYGCFEAFFDKIPINLQKSIFEVSQEFFDLPLQTKLKNISTKPFSGYVGQYHPSIPLAESMGIIDSNIPHKVEKYTQLLWPQGNPSFW
uniref:Gibberellin 20 oxidase n=1 Tax=Solanum tuberosum TaxID=4113 RepID=M1BDF3_SOLTU